jgi:hypothetical protein
MKMNSIKLVLFALIWAIIVYVVNCMIAHKFKRIELKQAVLYFSTVAMVGLFGEVFLDTVYNTVFGNPLWRYNILPIHDGYTSSYAVVTWGIYGLHLYLLHGTLKAKSIVRTRHLALIICLEALLLEALLTISAKLLLGRYLYYYYPGDLWHVSSFQNIPFYFIFGVVIINIVRRFQASPKFFSLFSLWLVVIIAFLT